ncbi:hypothetical protein MYAM1_001982 [Malassezia yamatoensis]|uniref:RNI-like protein n=1 Tax=Malassezia yamatoensis TaxID=253288 RepID=A0AAJ6CHW7_9BASI|nr:hypothetical protein MYAM1_001982 [Malassezia yamatoensis]
MAMHHVSFHGEDIERVLYPGNVPIDPCIRELDLSSNHLASFEKSGLTNIVYENSTLNVLELQGNELGRRTLDREPLEEIRKFSQAVGTSNLRTLNITANRLGNEGIAAFFESLFHNGSTLKTLYLSVNTFEDETSCIHAAKSIAAFLSNPSACRSLERLHLNGNQFGWHGVRTIVNAVLGSSRACSIEQGQGTTSELFNQSAPNRSLLILDLFSNGIDSMDTLSSDHNMHAFDWEQSSELTPSNWSENLELQLENNLRDRTACRNAAMRLLCAARIVGCRSRDLPNGNMSNILPILRLPLELRGLILEKIAPELSHVQFTDVLRYASEPSTLGYGLWQVDYPVDVKNDVQMNLPLPHWSWRECFETKSKPRNWYAESMDLHRQSNDLSKRYEPDQLAFWECTGTDHA